MNRPLLGVAGRWGPAEVEAARRFDDLHQLIYTTGGIRPSNAAVEEVAKLVLVRLWSLRHPQATLSSGIRAADLFRDAAPRDVAEAFRAALTSPDLVAVDPAGRVHPVWPLDEPFRLVNEAVLAAAARIIAELVHHGRPAVCDPLGIAFDALLAGRYDHAGGLGTYLTPSGVARMMAEIAADLVDATPTVGIPGFGDPYCGTGRFLVALLEVLRERDDATARHLLAAGAFGADQAPSSVAKARINMLLYGVERPLVWTVQDSVTDPDLDRYAGRIPLLLTNPPFGGGKYDNPDGVRRTAAALPRLAGAKRLDPSLACLVRAAHLLSPGGVLGIVLPDGVVESRAFADLVAGPVSLVATVSLPTATFALSGTMAKTSAVFLRRGRPSRHVAVARVEHVGYLRRGGKAAPDPAGDELPEVSRLVRAGLSRADVATLSVESTRPLVAIAVAESLSSTQPARLDPDAMRARQLLTERGGVQLRELLSARKVRHAAETTVPFISVLHVDDVGTVDWTAARTYAPATPGILADEGDLIVSLLNPSRLRAAVIPKGAGTVQVSAEFGVFRATCDPYAVLGLLYSPLVRAQLAPLGRGTSSSRRRIAAEDVLSLIVPKLSAPALDELGRSVREAATQITAGRDRLHALFAAVAGQAGAA